MRYKRQLAAGLAVAVAGGFFAFRQAPSAEARSIPDDVPPRTLTLVTGDRVTVAGPGDVSAEAGPGRQGVTFAITTDGERVTVVPSDAGPLLAAGRVDARLFDVSRLLELGYDDRDHLPLILTGGTTVSVRGLAKERALPAIDGVAVRQPRGTAAEAWRALTGGAPAARALKSNVDKIWLDGTLTPALDVSVPRIGAPAAWEAGYTGDGVTVAVLDSGIDGGHPDLAGRVIDRANLTDGVEPDGDFTGHGTHVASTVAGRAGVAPGAKLLDGKVCVDGGCAESWIVAGMTWAAERGATVVNMSLGGADEPEVIDPVEAAVAELSARHGTLFVVTSGNTDGGVVEGAIGSPGTAPAALTVGAVDEQDVVANFSRRGPGPHGTLKPDITAPGVDIRAAAPGGGYATMSGTSMAAPHVAGAAAILSQRHPKWTGQQLKAALMAAAQPGAEDGVYAQGAGRVDIGRAVRQTVTSRTASVGFDAQRWPHDDDPVQTREVVYHNDGDADVTLALTVPAPVFTVDSDTVVVPAGGDATVTVTADTRVSSADGYVGGWLTATAGAQVLRTPVGVHKEVESYDVTFIHRDRAGGVPSSFLTMVTDRGGTLHTGQWGPDPGDSFTLRLPMAHYSVIGNVSGAGGTALLARPDLYVDRPLTVEMDGRLARPVSVTVPRPAATQVYAQLSAYTLRPDGTAGMSLGGESFEELATARIGPDVPDDRFLTLVGGQWTHGAEFYALLFPERGGMLTGYQRVVAQRELATVRAEFALADPGTTGLHRVSTGVMDGGFKVGGFGPFLRLSLPATRTEYYNTDPGVRSRGWFTVAAGDEPLSTTMTVTPTEYRAGKAYRERWNVGVFGPALPPTDLLWQGAVRTGDTIRANLPLLTDGAGHAGDSTVTRLDTSLFRDGAPVPDREGAFEVPAGEAAYRLVMSAERGAPFALSTKVDVAWTFRSAHTGATAALPLWAVRFAPPVDQRNAVPAGRVVRVPMTVSAQPGANVGRLAGGTVEVSFDDGASWAAVPVRDGAALVRHPAGSGFVSLRATATDAGGNAVEQTIIRAYGYDLGR
ncbi:S8 family serine peptidase [Actinomycetes bacterium KLBMP 9797]